MIAARFGLIATAIIALLCASLTCGQELTVMADKVSGVYQPGQALHWNIEWKGAPDRVETRYYVKKNGLNKIAEGTIQLQDGAASWETALDEPAALLAEIHAISADSKEQTAYGGAVVAADKIAPSAARPDDFDDFWTKQLSEIQPIPLNEKLTITSSDRLGVDYWKIMLDNIGGAHIQGQLARPTKGDRLPAMLIVQWAGVYPLQKAWVTDRAAEGWLALNISAHDLPIDEVEAFYKRQSEGPLKDYWAIGNDGRETSYFLRMYLAGCRAADYLSQRADWNGKTLVVTGVSQGGQQALVIAGLHPKVTAALALVPAGCDMLGPELRRAPGWPRWYWSTEGKDASRVRQASRYYDVVNFAPRVHCPALVGLGLIDQVCPPSGVFAAFNQLAGPKEVVVLLRSEHQEKDHSQAEYYRRWGAWTTALRQCEPPPVEKNDWTSGDAKPSKLN